MISDNDKLLVNSDRIAVLVIDMHRGHLGESDPREAVCPTLLGRTIIPALTKFIGSMRQLKIPIIFARFTARRDFVDCKSKFWCSEKVLRNVPQYHKLNVEPLPDNWFVIPPEPEDHLILSKRRYSAFYGTDLEVLLRCLNVETLVLTGIDTDVCVLSTAWDSVNRDFLTFVISDCTHCSSESSKAAALEIMDKWAGWVLDSDEFLKVIRDLRGGMAGMPEGVGGGAVSSLSAEFHSGYQQGIKSPKSG